MALIVSHALPKGLQTFDQIDGVWVTEPRCAVAVAIALRESLIALAAARAAGEGQQTKMEVVYQYLTGPRFRHRIEAVVERFSEMQADPLPQSSRLLRRQRLARRVNPPPIEPFQQSCELRSRQPHHTVLRIRPAELAILEPLGEQA
jgi:Uncharacterized protein conserved in bacteria (DUF2130)